MKDYSYPGSRCGLCWKKNRDFWIAYQERAREREAYRIKEEHEYQKERWLAERPWWEKLWRKLRGY